MRARNKKILFTLLHALPLTVSFILLFVTAMVATVVNLVLFISWQLTRLILTGGYFEMPEADDLYGRNNYVWHPMALLAEYIEWFDNKKASFVDHAPVVRTLRGFGVAYQREEPLSREMIQAMRMGDVSYSSVYRYRGRRVKRIPPPLQEFITDDND